VKLFRTTKEHAKYWKDRKIDWNKEYLSTWNHPHRYFITSILAQLNWVSLIEVGCGAGANLVNIIKQIEGKQVGGIDINPDAIELAQNTFKGGMFKVSQLNDIILSDDSTDVVLSDMVYIYVGRWKIDEYIKEIQRITRNYVVLCEFHSESLWERFKLKWTSGYNAYNWKRLLEKHDFVDIKVYKLPDEAWPGQDPKTNLRRIIVARKI